MKKTKILIIRFRRVGDAVLTSSLCTTLKKSNPEIEIHYVLDAPIGSLFEGHPDIDRVIKFTSEEKNSFFVYLKKIWQLVRKERYDAIIDTRTTINTLYFSLFSLGTRYRIGIKKSYTKFIHNYRIDIQDPPGYIEKMQSLLAPLNREFSIVKNESFRLSCFPVEKSYFNARMLSAGIDFHKPVVCCAVATRIKYKRWPFKKMKAVLEFLIREYDAQLIFNFSGPEETEYAKQLYLDMDCDPHLFINIEAKNIRELMVMISCCHFFFGNEGGPRHISQAMGIPSFAIFPPGISKKVWLPDQNGQFAGIEPADLDRKTAEDPTVSYDDKFSLITVEEVIERLKESFLFVKV